MPVDELNPPGEPVAETAVRAPAPRAARRKSPVSVAVRRPILPAGLVKRGQVASGKERAMLADYLKLLAWWLGRPPTPAMPPRLDQTLRSLLRGHSEKEIATELGVSVHTVHDYVKDLHRRLGVTSRSELLVRFLPSGGLGVGIGDKGAGATRVSGPKTNVIPADSPE